MTEKIILSISRTIVKDIDYSIFWKIITLIGVLATIGSILVSLLLR